MESLKRIFLNKNTIFRPGSQGPLKKIRKIFNIKTDSLIDFKKILVYDFTNHGGVAHLARAFEWHSKGSRFKSDHLQKKVMKRHA